MIGVVDFYCEIMEGWIGWVIGFFLLRWILFYSLWVVSDYFWLEKLFIEFNWVLLWNKNELGN